MKHLILRNFQSPGDVLMLTAAVRDLHRAHPGRYRTDVRTSCPELWMHNPHITPLGEGDRRVQTLDCHYPLIHQSGREPVHFLHGFMEYLNEQLGTRIRSTAIRGDLHLSRAETSRPSLMRRLTGVQMPYWIVVAGGKYDFTIKWWHFKRFQALIDHFRGRIQFVQVGEKGHYHPPLEGVIPLEGKTRLRDLILLVRHASGVLCPVTFLMHLAAALEPPRSQPSPRPCVVVAGGREPPHWEAYPHHQFLHTVGALSCCATTGCWRSRTVALGLGDEKDQPEALCLDVIKGLPRCMDMITPADVIRRIEYYFENGQARYLTAAERRRAAPHVRRSQRELLRQHLA